MSTTEISRQLRLLLDSSSQSVTLADVLSHIDIFIRHCTSSAEPDSLLYLLEEELQAIHRDVVNHESLEQTEIFLAVLQHLLPVLSSTSLISAWFELVLRPALREPKLPRNTISHAQDLVIAALEKIDQNHPEKVGDFRRRILDLYLLDAYNEGSQDDVVEWAELPQEQREKRNVWKSNLESILVRFGMEKPHVRLFFKVVIPLKTRSQRNVGFIDSNFPLLRIAFIASATSKPVEPIHFLTIF